MNFFKTTFYTSLSTAVTFICGFIVAKVVAVKIGPSGFAMVGQFQNTTAMLAVLGTGAIQMGVVKYLSENKDNRKEQQKIITNSISIVVICSLLLSAFIMLCSGWLSVLAFHTRDFWLVYFLFGLFLGLTSLNAIFSAMFNGLKEIKKLTFSTISFSIAGIIFTVLFAQIAGVKGVLIAVNATAVIACIVNFALFSKLPAFSLKPSIKNWDKKIIRRF